jgi:hypothetical protein
MNNIHFNNQLIKNEKSKIYYWSKIPYINNTLNDLFKDLIKEVESNNYELTFDESIIYSKFVSLVYHLNIL